MESGFIFAHSCRGLYSLGHFFQAISKEGENLATKEDIAESQKLRKK